MISPLTAERWPALEDLFGRAGASNGCWCMYQRAWSYRQPVSRGCVGLRPARLPGPRPAPARPSGDATPAHPPGMSGGRRPGGAGRRVGREVQRARRCEVERTPERAAPGRGGQAARRVLVPRRTGARAACNAAQAGQQAISDSQALQKVDTELKVEKGPAFETADALTSAYSCLSGLSSSVQSARLTKLADQIRDCLKDMFPGATTEATDYLKAPACLPSLDRDPPGSVVAVAGFQPGSVIACMGGVWNRRLEQWLACRRSPRRQQMNSPGCFGRWRPRRPTS